MKEGHTLQIAVPSEGTDKSCGNAGGHNGSYRFSLKMSSAHRRAWVCVPVGLIWKWERASVFCYNDEPVALIKSIMKDTSSSPIGVGELTKKSGRCTGSTRRRCSQADNGWQFLRSRSKTAPSNPSCASRIV